jgi:putative hydrolase of the HAD superfamily
LKSQGYKLGVVANVWSGGIRPALQKLGLQKFFDTMVASVDVGFRKPSSEIFQLVLNNLEIGAERAMMVGDNPLSDIQGAHDIGICTVRLMRGPNRTKPDIVNPDFKIKNLSTLAAIVRTYSNSRV